MPFAIDSLFNGLLADILTLFLQTFLAGFLNAFGLGAA